MVITPVLTPWFVFCRLLPSLHLAVAISPLLSVISLSCYSCLLLGWLSTGAGVCINLVVQFHQAFPLKWWVWVVAVNRSITMVGAGRRELSQTFLLLVVLKQNLDHGAHLHLETPVAARTHRQRI